MLLDLSLKEISEGLKKGDFSNEDLISESYDNIEKYNPKINAFITVIDKEIALKLKGIPYGLKDVYLTKGVRTTSGSNVLKDYIPQYNASVVNKLSEYALVGKMNLDAWGHGGSSENTDFGPVHNPWNLDRVAGGSSGGPAAAIATRMVAFAIGEDTGGSIRNPSAWCNTTGLKVTYGRVSRYGCISYASSFDSVGPMAKTAEDCAFVLEQIAGQDPFDATSSPFPVPKYSEVMKKDIKNMVVGIPKELFGTGLDKEIHGAIETAMKKMEDLGVKTIDVSLPILDYIVSVYYLIGLSETSSNMARYDGIRFGCDRNELSEETKRRIMIGTYALSSGYYDAYYRKAQKARTLLIKEYNNVLDKCDAIVMPVNPTPPTKFGELINDPLKNYLWDIYTCSVNPVGVPSLALPCGFTKDNLPIGLQLVGKMFAEDVLLQFGYQYQNATDWHLRRPKII